ncbi:MAG: tRNA glutamyl-Q(34) synthetase GluQRS [Azospirillaceae bacterium]|nr:tRNA glutamyl-Q(34) synthetase GluQRS [Azospirillaceae bacterium]
MPGSVLPVVTRFAPSPTGHLHLGHAHAALFGWRTARAAGGQFLLRIEDIDTGRCRPVFETDLIEDLRWLGLDWDGPIRRQSAHFDDYRAARAQLEALGLLYRCFCTRRDVAAEIGEAAQAPHGLAGSLYPGRCRTLSPAESDDRAAAGHPFAWRLDARRALALTGPLTWTDRLAGTQSVCPETLGDVVLARKDTPTSYHLSVTVDDAIQGVTLVTRGVDLFHATAIHRLLQALLALPVPQWHHHPLLTDDQGRRLAKRDGARSLRALRATGLSPAQVRALAGMT